jgi:putative pyruvate formate lyase activating enzyme
VNFLEDLEIRLEEALKIPTDCVGCYRYCHINRWSSDSTYCHTGIDPKLISANITEDNQFFSKDKKIAKVYFRHCNLRCVYCYDYALHHENYLDSNGKISLEEYGELIYHYFLNDEVKAIHLINVDHLIPHTLFAITYAIKKYGNLKIPIIFESNGFAFRPTIHFLRDLIQIYLMDFKFISSDLSRKYLKEENYPEIAKDTVFELYNQVGDIALKQDTLQKGLVVRLLVLPNLYKEYYEILDFLKAVSLNIGIWISSKYVPSGIVPKKGIYQDINQLPNQEEVRTIFEYAQSCGFSWIFLE